MNDEICTTSTTTWRWRSVNIVLMGLGFLTVFVSFNTAENFTTSLYGQGGMASLSLIYISFAVCSIVVPAIIQRIGERWTLVVGAAAILPFILINVFANVTLLIAFSAVVGFGQAVMWCAQGSLLTRCSPPEKRGRNSGIFFFIYQLNQIVGNGVAYALSALGVPLRLLFAALTALCLAGTAPFVGIRMSVLPDVERVSLRTNVRTLWGVLRSRTMLLLVPLFVFSGATQCFIYGQMTMLYGTDLVAVGMCVFGAANTVGPHAERLTRSVAALRPDF